MNSPSFDDLTDALSSPVGDLISAMGENLADAQKALDLATLESFKAIYQADGGAYEALRKIGYRPTWYQIPELQAEVNMALTVSGSTDESGRRRPGRLVLYAQPVDATFANKYGFEYQAASKVTFKIVPIPPSALAEGMRVVPSVIGLTLEEARNRLEADDIASALSAEEPAENASSVRIGGQSPGAGEFIRADETLTLTLETH